jgi:beta-galactosidase
VLEVDGQVVLDRFWDSTPWRVGVDALGLAPGAELTLRIVPLHPDADVRLPAEAEARRRLSSEPLLALDGVRLATTTLWVEAVAAG